MTRNEDKAAESFGRKVGAFLSGLFSWLFSDKKNLLIMTMVLGFGVDKASGFMQPKETYWDEQDIQKIIAQSIEKEMNKPGSKMDRLAASIDALIKAQNPSIRLKVFEELARYDRRANRKDGE